MNILARLQVWYVQHCNGVWEHTSGITIQTCDHPGWWGRINLAGTPLQACAFPRIVGGVDEQNIARGRSGYACYRQGDVWHGAGDAAKLERILESFLAGADTSGSTAA